MLKKMPHKIFQKKKNVCKKKCLKMFVEKTFPIKKSFYSPFLQSFFYFELAYPTWAKLVFEE